MFQLAGHKVTSWSAAVAAAVPLGRLHRVVSRRFSSPLEESLPVAGEMAFHAPDRTLIYVGRDFDAAPWYWEKVLPMAPADQADLIRDRLTGPGNGSICNAAACPSRRTARGSWSCAKTGSEGPHALGRGGVAGRRGTGKDGNRAGLAHRARERRRHAAEIRKRRLGEQHAPSATAS